MRKRSLSLWRLFGLMIAGALPSIVSGDGFGVDKIYHPYVQPLEREIEFRSLFVIDADDAIDGSQLYSLGLGKSFTDRLRGEIYLIGENNNNDNLSLKAYELEVQWQLTEQGAYFADWGLLFELEKGRGDDVWEYATTLLVEKELGRWGATVNLSGIYEWGEDISNELESRLAVQLRYRYARAFEPAIELFSSQNTKGIGPAALGSARFSSGRKLSWEFGLIFGIDGDSPDQTIRTMLEYEF